jgi:branched-chain amino acid transport system ATP-binding protein
VSPLLDIADLNVFYGDAQALWDVSISVHDGEICALIGANGAGKTTTLKTISGLIHSFTGQIEFLGSTISRAAPHAVVDLGISLVPEGRRIFSKLTVLENLELGAFTRRARPLTSESLEWILEIFPILKDRKADQAAKLSGGMQQMVAIGRALMARPKLLMLDEPSLGLAPLVVKMVFEVVQSLNERDVTILLVEQNIHQALKIAHHGFVLKTGKITMRGRGDELLADEEVQRAYMGILR